MSKYKPQLQIDIRYEKIFPNHARKGTFHGEDVIDDVTRWPQSSCLGEVGTWSKLQANYLVNKYRNGLFGLHMHKEDLNK